MMPTANHFLKNTKICQFSTTLPGSTLNPLVVRKIQHQWSIMPPEGMLTPLVVGLSGNARSAPCPVVGFIYCSRLFQTDFQTTGHC